MRLRSITLILLAVGLLAPAAASAGCNGWGMCSSVQGGLVMRNTEGQAATGFSVKNVKGAPGVLTAGLPFVSPTEQTARWSMITPGGGWTEVGTMVWMKVPATSAYGTNSAVLEAPTAPPTVYTSIIAPELPVEGEAVPAVGQTMCIRSVSSVGTECGRVVLANATIGWVEHATAVCATSTSTDVGGPAWITGPKGGALAVGVIVGGKEAGDPYYCRLTIVQDIAQALQPPAGVEPFRLVTTTNP